MSPQVTSITFSAAATPAVHSMPMLGAAEPSLISLSLAAPPLGLCSLPMLPWCVSVNSYWRAFSKHFTQFLWGRNRTSDERDLFGKGGKRLRIGMKGHS